MNTNMLQYVYKIKNRTLTTTMTTLLRGDKPAD